MIKDEYIMESDTVIRFKTFYPLIPKGYNIIMPTPEQYSETDFVKYYRGYHQEYVFYPRCNYFMSQNEIKYPTYVFKVDGDYALIYYWLIKQEDGGYQLFSAPQVWYDK